MAEYQLSVFTHWSSCLKCQASQNCDEIQSLPMPDYLSNANAALEGTGGFSLTLSPSPSQVSITSSMEDAKTGPSQT